MVDKVLVNQASLSANINNGTTHLGQYQVSNWYRSLAVSTKSVQVDTKSF